MCISCVVFFFFFRNEIQVSLFGRRKVPSKLWRNGLIRGLVLVSVQGNTLRGLRIVAGIFLEEKVPS